MKNYLNQINENVVIAFARNHNINLSFFEANQGLYFLRRHFDNLMNCYDKKEYKDDIDALRCCGMPDGEYELGGQQVFLQGGIAKLLDGTIAGAATNLYQGMVNAILFGIPEADAVRAATFNPACALGVQDRVGSIATGKFADFIVCRSDYTGRRVFLAGKEL